MPVKSPTTKKKLHTQFTHSLAFSPAQQKCWSHNPVATFSLCLLAQAYDLSACLILKFAEVDVTVGFLMQIDKLVQLLESPVFIHLRLQLLEVNTKFHADLLKSLYGLLMLLPQSQAYKTLSDRLSTVSSLQMHMGFPRAFADGSGSSSSSSGGGVRLFGGGAGGKDSTFNKKIDGVVDETTNKPVDYVFLLGRFEEMQEKHTSFRLALLRSKSLLSSSYSSSPSFLTSSSSSASSSSSSSSLAAASSSSAAAAASSSSSSGSGGGTGGGEFSST